MPGVQNSKELPITFSFRLDMVIAPDKTRELYAKKLSENMTKFRHKKSHAIGLALSALVF